MQQYKPEKIFYNRMKISKFIVDETQIKVGKDYFGHGLPLSQKIRIFFFIFIIFQQKETHGCCRTYICYVL
jgi:hypothetical protein